MADALVRDGDVEFERGACSARPKRVVWGIFKMSQHHRFVGDVGAWGGFGDRSQIEGTCRDCGDRYRNFGLTDEELRSFHATAR